MKSRVVGIFIVLGVLLWVEDSVYSAHILEPLGTEIASTPPRGRMFGQIEYLYTKDDPKTEANFTAHRLPLEFEIGVGERTQLNLEASLVIHQKEEGVQGTGSGIQELAFGLKHRFLDETTTLPDAGFLVEFAPAAGLKGDEAEFKTTLLFTKNFSKQFLVHLETGYLLETERESELEMTEVKTVVKNSHIFVYNIAPVYRLIPDRLLLVTEMNGTSNFKTSEDKIVVRPEIILAIQNLALKISVPVGITSEADDYGVHFGISRLF